MMIAILSDYNTGIGAFAFKESECSDMYATLGALLAIGEGRTHKQWIWDTLGDTARLLKGLE